MVSHKIYHLNINEEFSVSWTSKLLTYFIDGFTLWMRSQSIAYLPGESEHTYWILGLKVEVHSIWVLWTRRPSGMQTIFFEVGRGRVGNVFQSHSKSFYGVAQGLQVAGPGLILSTDPFLKKPNGGALAFGDVHL